MKKTLTATLTILLALLTASVCFGGEKSKSLIVYYSLSGNTKAVAQQLQTLTGSAIAAIQTVKPYPAEYQAVVKQAGEERRAGFLPPIQALTVNPADYDVIYVGYPVWGSTLPQPMATFLSQNNLAGKTIIPFCTHAGYGAGRSFTAIAEYCPQAKILTGFDMLGKNVGTAEELLKNWLSKIGMAAQNTVKNETAITVTIGNAVLSGTLNNNSPTAKEFIARLPQTITMGEFGGREYYGRIANRIQTTEEGQLRFNDGDITYCPQNNSVALFFAQTNRPNLTMKVIPMGTVTSDLSVFKNFDKSIPVTFSMAK